MAFFSTYHPLSQSGDYYFSRVSNWLDAFSPTYGRFLLVGNFNGDYSKETLFNILQKRNAANIVKDKPCFKSLNNLSCIDLFTTNQPSVFIIQLSFPQAYEIFIKLLLLS